MPFLTTDHSQGGGFEPLPNGNYECIISEVEVIHDTPNKVKMVLVVRTDVEQDHGGRKIYDTLTASEAAQWRFQQLTKALGFEDGYEFDTIGDYAEAIAYKEVKVKTKQQASKNDPDKIFTNVDRFLPTEEGVASAETRVNTATYGGRKSAPSNDPFADDGKPIDISDDDLPF